ncbi:RICIN domain-containing protein [Streptosporangium sp. NPDC051023]|uniref:RICIN domain-containing protein n=1 Tax=Streptosporangium sp. NPDC051023 TaxID=3155410 RepID=UPI00344FE39D
MGVKRGFWKRVLAVALPALILVGVAPATPAAASGSVIVPQVHCVGDGTSGHRVKLIYAYESGSNRFAEKEDLIRQAAWITQENVNDSARRDGAERWIRFETTGSTGCDLAIDSVQVPTGSSNGNWTGALQNLGYTDTDHIYIAYFEKSTGCGGTVGDSPIANDDSSGTGNRHNSYATWITLSPGCSTGHEMTHELAHALGGILPNAPHYDGPGAHCTDSNETLCQGGSTVVCSDPLAVRLMDCGKDDYFGVTPVGTYLSTHWNAANHSLYLEHGSSVPTMTTIPPLAPQLFTGVDVQGNEIVFVYEPSTKVEGSGVTREAQVLRNGTVVATVPIWQHSVRVTGLTSNTSATYTVRERITYGGVTRTSAESDSLIVLTGTSSTPAGAVADGITTIFTNDVVDSSGPNLAMDLYSFSEAENAPIVQWPQNSVKNQQWRLTAAGGGAYTITSAHSGKCLTPLSGSGTAGTAVVQVTCSGATAQKWTFPSISGITYQIKASVGTNQCIQASGGGTGGGTALVLGTCNSSASTQRWTSNRTG